MKEVTYKSKTIEVEGKDPNKPEKQEVLFMGPDGKVGKKGDKAIVTDKHAIWLKEHDFVSSVKDVAKKEEKEEKNKRETK